MNGKTVKRNDVENGTENSETVNGIGNFFLTRTVHEKAVMVGPDKPVIPGQRCFGLFTCTCTCTSC